MPKQDDQQFLHELDKKLWTSADKLRSNLDAAVYKHAVLGLIFLKYVSDAFNERREVLEGHLRDAKHDYYLDPGDYESAEAYEAEVLAELELRDNYLEKNVFWVPEQARWQVLQDCAKLPMGEKLPWGDKMRSVGWLIDNALDAVEKENPKLKGILNKQYTQLQIDHTTLGQLIDLIASVPFTHASVHTTVDWQVRDSVRAKLRNLVRRLLRKYKYPPDKQPEAITLILEQATVMADAWSGEPA